MCTREPENSHVGPPSSNASSMEKVMRMSLWKLKLERCVASIQERRTARLLMTTFSGS